MEKHRGCSSGALLLVAKECGYKPFGAEPAEQAAATAQKLGFDVFPGFLHDAHYPDNHFDVVTPFEVIEHLLVPEEVVREIQRILKPGGLLLIGTGNADSWTVKLQQGSWEYFDIRSHGGHISSFNPKSIRYWQRSAASVCMPFRPNGSTLSSARMPPKLHTRLPKLCVNYWRFRLAGRIKGTICLPC